MGSSPRSFRIAALAAGSVGLAGAITFAGGAQAAGPASFCRASLLQVSIAGNALPELASAEGCTEQEGGVGLIDLDPIPVKARLLYAHTNSTAPNAESGVADLTIDLSAGGGPVIGVQVLKSEASATCNGTTPVLSGKSRVVGLTLDGEDTPLVIPPGDEYTEIPADPLVNIKLNEQVKTASTVTQNALHVHALTGVLDIDVVVAQSQAGITGNPCAPTTTTTTGGTTAGGTTGNPPPPAVVGWMSGGGQLNDALTHSLTLPCTKTQAHPKPKLNVETPSSRFTLDTLSTVSCKLDPNQGDPEQPDAAFNTLEGTGTGTCNGVSGVGVTFRFTDEGEPNKGADEASIKIDNSACAVNATGTVNGNQQAHRSNNPPA
jgi:hypothetical protein